MSANKRQSVANRYLAAIECGATPSPGRELTQNPMGQTGPQSITTTLAPRATPHTYGTPEQDRGVGNSPSSSRKSRASRTPPRDPVDYSSPQKRQSFFARSSANPNNGDLSDGSSLTSKRTSDDTILGKPRLDSLSSLETDDSRPGTPTSLTEQLGDGIQRTPSKSPSHGWRRKLEGTSYGMKKSPPRSFLKDATAKTSGDSSWIKKKPLSNRLATSPLHTSPKRSPRFSPRHSVSTSRNHETKPLSEELLKDRLNPSSNASTAPTEIMTNLSRVTNRSPTQSVASTAVTTNRSNHFLCGTSRVIDKNGDDENDSIEEGGTLPQHAKVSTIPIASESMVTRAWPLPRQNSGTNRPRNLPLVVQQRVEIESILSCTSTEVSNVRGTTPSPVQTRSVGKLGRYVGNDNFKDTSSSSKASNASFHTKSITSSVGVETGGQSFDKGPPGLQKMLHAPRLPITKETIAVGSTTNEKLVIPHYLLGTREEDFENSAPERELLSLNTSAGLMYRSESGGQFQPNRHSPRYRIPDSPLFPSSHPSETEAKLLPKLSQEKDSSHCNNPFVVRYSSIQKQEKTNDNRILEPDVPQSPDSSGWTPVALSSSGVEVDDFFQNNPEKAQPNGLGKSRVIVPLFSPDRLDLGHSPLRTWSTKDAAKLVPKIDPPSIRRVTSTNIATRNSPLSEMLDSRAEHSARDTIEMTEVTTGETIRTPDPHPIPRQSLTFMLTRNRARDLINRRREERQHNTSVEKHLLFYEPSPDGNGELVKDETLFISRESISPDRKLEPKDLERQVVVRPLMGSEPAREVTKTPFSSHSKTIDYRIKLFSEDKGLNRNPIAAHEPRSAPSFMARRDLLPKGTLSIAQSLSQVAYSPSSLGDKDSNSRTFPKVMNPQNSGTSETFSIPKESDLEEVPEKKARKLPTNLADRFLSAVAEHKKEQDTLISANSEKFKGSLVRTEEQEYNRAVCNLSSNNVSTHALISDTSPFRGDKSPSNLILMGAHLASRADAFSSPWTADQYHDDEGTPSVDVQSIRSIFEGSLSSKVDIDDDDATIDSLDVKSLRSIFEMGGEGDARGCETVEPVGGVKKMLAMFEAPKPATASPKSFSGNNNVKEAFAKFEVHKMKKSASKELLTRRLSHVPASIYSALNQASDAPEQGPGLPADSTSIKMLPTGQAEPVAQELKFSPKEASPTTLSSRIRTVKSVTPTLGSRQEQSINKNLSVPFVGRKGQLQKTLDINNINKELDTRNQNESQNCSPILNKRSSWQSPSINIISGTPPSMKKAVSNMSYVAATPTSTEKSVSTASLVADVRRKWMEATSPATVPAPIILDSGNITYELGETKFGHNGTHKVENNAKNHTGEVTESQEELASPKRISVAERVRALKARQSPSAASPVKSPKNLSFGSSPGCMSSETTNTTTTTTKALARFNSSILAASTIYPDHPTLPIESFSPPCHVMSPQLKDKVTAQVDTKQIGTAALTNGTETHATTATDAEEPIHVKSLVTHPVASSASSEKNQELLSVRDKILAFSASQEPFSQESIFAERNRVSPSTSDSKNKSSFSSQFVVSTQTPRNQIRNLVADDLQNSNHRNQFKPVNGQRQNPSSSLETRASLITKKPLKGESSGFPLDSTSRTDSEGFDDGVTLDLSIADVSQLTNPTCLQSKEDPNDYSINDDDDSSDRSLSGQRTNKLEIDGRGPSEASSSQTSEAAAPLIARTMKRFAHSDDGSSKSMDRAHKWEPIIPVIDETSDSTWQGYPRQGMMTTSRVPQETHVNDPGMEEKKPMDEAAWDLRNITSSFPSNSPSSSDFEIDPFEVKPQPARHQIRNGGPASEIPRWKPFFHGDFSPPKVVPQPIVDSGVSIGSPKEQIPLLVHPARLPTRVGSAFSGSSQNPRRLRSPPAPISTSYRSRSVGASSSPNEDSAATLQRAGHRSSPTFAENDAKSHTQTNGTAELITERNMASASLFSRTHPKRDESKRKGAVVTGRRSTLTGLANEGPTKSVHGSFCLHEFPVREGSSSQVSSTFRQNSPPHIVAQHKQQERVPNESSSGSKHAALLLRLRSLKEGRMRRSTFTQPSPPYSSGHQTADIRHSAQVKSLTTQHARRPNFVAPPRAHTTSLSRPGVYSSQYIVNRNGQKYGVINDVEEEHSQSTRSSTRFGGNAFDDCLGLD